MSEFPWEVKKDSSKELSNKDGSGPDKAAIAGNAGAGPSIPDILASAFAGAPMEEIKLEPLSSSEVGGGQNTKFSPPDFGNLADISALVSNNDPNTMGTVPKPAGNMPSFMQADSSVGGENKNSGNASPSPFSIDEIAFNPPAFNLSGIGTPPPKKAARKSPPPLFMPVFPGEEPPKSFAGELPVKPTGAGPGNISSGWSDFSHEAPIFGNDASHSNPVPDQSRISDKAVMDMFLSNEEPLQEKMPDFGNPFSEELPSPDDPFSQASESENPFPGPMPNFNRPLPDYVEPSVNPFPNPFGSPGGTMPDTAKDTESPFSNPIPTSANPFSGSASQSDDPFSAPVQGSVNPFQDHVQSSMSPFPGPAPQSDNPFSDHAPQSPSPFPDFSPNAGNPFSGQMPAAGGSAAHSDLIGSIGASIKVDKILRNFDGVGVKVKSLLTGLTKGQSLIERMEGLAESGNDAVGQNSPSPFDEGTPFDAPFPTANPAPGPVFSSPGQSTPEPVGAEGTNGYDDVSLFGGSMERTISEDIRKVTPVAEPLMELREDQKIDFSIEIENDGLEIPIFDIEDNISKTIPVLTPEKKKSSIHPVDDLQVNGLGDLPDGPKMAEDLSSPEGATRSGSFSEGENARMGKMSSEIRGLRSELEGMLSRFNEFEGDVSDLSETVSGFAPLLSSGKENEELLSGTVTNVHFLDSKVGALEGKVSGIESALVSVQSDNEDIRSGLARIEENIAELVSSYTALLVQVHESAQETDSRFSRIESTLEMLESFESRFSAIEKTQEESRSTSVELARSVSSLVDGLGMTSSGFDEFRESCELRQDKLEKNIFSVTEYLDSELKKLGARSYKGFGQNVHLSNIMKNSTNMKLCMEWLEFLMGLVGRNNLPDILSYYEELSWITEEVRSELLHYAEGIDFYMEKPDWKLTPDDHVKSIWFIESLAGMKVDKNRLSVIDRDIEKVKKGNEIYGI